MIKISLSNIQLPIFIKLYIEEQFQVEEYKEQREKYFIY